MIARVLLSMLIVTPAMASTPAAWGAQERSARVQCLKASGLGNAIVTAPVIFGDGAGVDVLRVRGRITKGVAKGRAGTMLCLFARRTDTVEVQEAPSGW